MGLFKLNYVSFSKVLKIAQNRPFSACLFFSQKFLKSPKKRHFRAPFLEFLRSPKNRSKKGIFVHLNSIFSKIRKQKQNRPLFYRLNEVRLRKISFCPNFAKMATFWPTTKRKCPYISFLVRLG